MVMSNLRMLTAAVLLLSCPLLPGQALAQGKGRGMPGANAQQARQRLANALKQRAEAARKLAELKAKRSEAEDKLEEALAKLRKTREELLQRYESKPEVLQAKRQLKEAEQEYKQAIDAVLGQLHAEQRYKEALEAAERARAELAKLHGDDSASPEQRAKRIAELTRQIHLPQQLERDAIRSDPKAAAALQRLRQAQAEVSKRVAEARAAAEKDPTYAAASEEVEKAKAELAAVERDLELQAGELARADAALLTARRALLLSLQRQRTSHARVRGRAHRRPGRHYHTRRTHKPPAAKAAKPGQKPAGKPAPSGT